MVDIGDFGRRRLSVFQGDFVCDGLPWVEAEPRRFVGERREVKYILPIIQAILMEYWENITGGNPVV